MVEKLDEISELIGINLLIAILLVTTGLKVLTTKLDRREGNRPLLEK